MWSDDGYGLLNKKISGFNNKQAEDFMVDIGIDHLFYYIHCGILSYAMCETIR